jgi:2-phospho-L-lactate/phosphoenolpyruvate guanylyltransferase
MSVWAVVPVKPLERAKKRLKDVLSRDERVELNKTLLERTLGILAKVPRVERTLVVSRDSQVLSLARGLGAKTVSERGNPKLNRALARVNLVAQGHGASGVLVLPADLPLISQEDIDKLISMMSSPPVVVIAPDRHRSGTNAILSSPPGLIEYDFGPGSFGLHQERAELAGVRIEICDLPSLALDLDRPDDLEHYRKTSISNLFKKKGNKK